MARKAFTGDHVKELPKGKVEPYRLWFEFLKLALEMQPERVNLKFYEPWGDVSKISFNDWFPQNWQRLFAVPASLTLVTSLSEAENFLADQKSVLVRIDRTGPVKRQIEDFKKILKASREPRTKTAALRPAFEVTSKRSMINASLRAQLKLLGLFHKHNGKIDEATKEYYLWATKWNKEIRDKKWNRQQIRIPIVLTTFASEIERYENEVKSSPSKIKKRVEYYGARSDANRFLRKARKILDNVCAGRFPGVS